MTITLDGTTGITTPGLTNTGTSTFTSVAVSGAVTLSGGTANGVAYLDGSKVLTTGTALTFNGTTFTSTGSQGLLNTVGGNTARMIATAAGTYFGSTTAADVIFQQNSTEGMRLTSTGLGIGTSSPGFALDISQAAPRIRQTATTGTNSSLIQLVNTGGTAYVGLDNSSAGLSTAYALNLFHSGAYPIVFSTSGTERMRLDSSGNLGIGTSSPSSRLNVDGGSLATSGVGILAAGSISTGRLISGGGTTVNAVHTYYDDRAYELSAGSTSGYVSGIAIGARSYSGTGGDAVTIWTRSAERMRLDSSGNLGIGTSSPAYKLDVNGVANFAANVGHRVGAALFFAGTGTSSGLNYLYTNTTAMAWRNAADSAELMRLDNSGNLLVGTTTAGAKLCLQVVATGTGILERWAATGGTAAYFEVNSVNVGSITTTTTATAYNTSSDYRLKNITGPITNSGAYIDSLKPVEGTWKADGSTFVGLIAHEVQEASRTVVATGTKDGEEMQGMDYSSAELIANLIAEIQSLRVRLNALESK
jgi:hypothetical protein